jgi:hypothetical protein
MDKSEKPLNSHVSAYLQRPLRTLKKAEQDNDAARHHLISASSAEHELWRHPELDPLAPRFPEPVRKTPASTEKADLKR